MRKKIMSVVAVLTMMVLATGSAWAGPGDHHDDKDDKKDDKKVEGFLGGTTEVRGVVQSGPDPVVNVTVTTYSSGGMDASPKDLGRGTYAISAATQVWDFGPGCGASSIIAADSGTATLTSAKDGSTVTGPVTGSTCELAPFDNTRYATTLAMTITGGTGRFVGATGSIGISGIQTFNAATGGFDDQSTLKGKIQLP